MDPLAVYNPVMETQFYGDGEHNGGVYNSGNLNPYIYTYQNPIRFIDPNGKQVDAVDFIPFVGSARDIYRGARDGDWVTLGIGVVGLAVDIGTAGSGSIIKGGIKAGVKAGIKEVSEQGVKLVAKKTSQEILEKKLAKGLIMQGEKFSAKSYRHNLQVFTKMLGEGKDAHHIFPKAKKFAEFFSNAGIDVNNPANMKWLESTIHRGKNSAAHLKEWEAVMEKYAGKTPTIKQLQKEAARIEKIFKK